MTDPAAAVSRIYTPQGGTFTEDFTLVSGTELLSSHRQQHVATQGGQRYLPGSGSTTATIVNGTITLADKTRVEGFTINGQLAGDAVETVTLHRNVINASAGKADDLDLLDNTVLDAAIQAIEVEATGATTSTWIVSGNALSGSGAGDVAEAIFTNSGTGTVNLTLTGNSSTNDPAAGEFNFDLLNTGGGGFTIDSSASNSGTVGSSDGSVVIP